MTLRNALAVAVLTAACGGVEPAPFVPPDETVPELVVAVDQDPDPDVVEVTLVADEGEVEFRPGVKTTVWGFRDGAVSGSAVTVPGPLISAKRGDLLRVHFRNDLDGSPTTVHWHGLRLPNDQDGNPMVSGAVAPGETFEYEFVVPDAATFWYHPHVDTDEQVARGMYGPLLVRDPADDPVDFDRLFVLDDVDLDEAGQVVLEATMDAVAGGRRGADVLVNGGLPSAIVTFPGAFERWRFVNASNGRFFSLSLPGRTLTVIGEDGGEVAAPYEVGQLLIAPGERYEVLWEVDASVGGDVTLSSLQVERPHGGNDEPVDLFTVFVGPAPDGGSAAAPAFGRAIEPLPVVLGETPERTFELTAMLDNPAGPLFFINGQRWPLNTPVLATLGDTEIWNVVNDADGHHPFHLHGVFFQVLTRDGAPEPLRAWKDTVRLGPGETVQLAVPYERPGMWMFHCTIPEHAERGMMGDLEVE